MALRLLAILIFILPNMAMAEDYYSPREWFTPYQSSDYIAEGVFLGLVSIDYLQTSDFRRDGERESNTICLGHYPDQGTINRCFGMGILFHGMVTYALPREWRPIWHTFSITLESVAVYSNHAAGYDPKFAVNFRVNFN
jgi:hypothetical protein